MLSSLHLRHSAAAGAHGAAFDRPHQRRLLRDAEPRARGPFSGMLNIVNFTHGAQYMMGAFLRLSHAEFHRHRLLVVAASRAHRSSAPSAWCWSGFFIRHLYQLDHLYGLLLTFGLGLILEGLFRQEWGSSGMPYSIPPQLTGARNLGFMFLPNYRAWVIVASIVICATTWFVIERTRLGLYLRARDREPGRWSRRSASTCRA